MTTLHTKRHLLDRHHPNGVARLSPVVSKRVKGMEGNGYYNKNSRPQAAGAELGLLVWRNAVQQVLDSSNHTAFLQARLQTLHIADYGSSQGRNSVAVIRTALAVIPETATVVVTHVDLPTNDFNSLIKVTCDPVEGYTKQDKQSVFVSARGSSFYDRVFPEASVHIGWSAIATHWISEIPDVPLNHFAVHSATNPEKIAWVERARDDWKSFVDHRAHEIVSGGHYVQIGIARDDDGVNGSEGIHDLTATCLKAVLSPEQYQRLRLPVYCRSKDEFLAPFLEDPDTWRVEHVDIKHGLNPAWTEYEQDHDLEKYVESVVGVLRAAYIAGLIRDENCDLVDFYDRFKKGLRANPALGKLEWRLIVLDVERL